MDVEEWWGRAFEKRGSVLLRDLPDGLAATLRKLSTEDLALLISSEGDRSNRGLLAAMEMRRRENWTARAAIAISILALLVAIFRPS